MTFDQLIAISMQRSTWSFTSSSGGEASVGDAISIAASIGKLYVKESSAQNSEQLSLYGLGINIGVSELPFSVTLSSSNAPGTGVGAIYAARYLGNRSLTRSDFRGPCCVVEVGGGMSIGASGYVVFFGGLPGIMPELITYLQNSGGVSAIGSSLGANANTAFEHLLRDLGINNGNPVQAVTRPDAGMFFMPRFITSFKAVGALWGAFAGVNLGYGITVYVGAIF